MGQDFEKIKASDRQQIKQRQDNLDLFHHSSQTIQVLVTQCNELIEKLQAILTLTECTTIEILAFKTQASEINERLEVSQQEIYQKVDAIQKCYQVVDISLKVIYVKEKGAY